MCQPLTRPALRLGDILRQHGPAYAARHPVTPEQAQVLRRLADCRTATLGGHLETCAACGFSRVSYNSCRDRHCPTCQAAKRAAWLEARLQRLLPVPYFHVVFTVPDVLYPLMLHNQRRLYELLFRAASAGLSRDGQRWVAGKRRFFLPVKVLGRLFRGKFLAGLKDAYRAHALSFEGSARALAAPRAFGRLLDACYHRAWVVYAKPPFGGPERVFRYLGRYSHRVAIANSRLRGLDDTRVAFAWKDYADGRRDKVMSLAIDEFIRRFLLHVLPKGFVRIRHYGLLAGVNVPTKLEQCRRLLEATPAAKEVGRAQTSIERVLDCTEHDPTRCPQCQGPLMRWLVRPVLPVRAPPRGEPAGPQPAGADSS